MGSPWVARDECPAAAESEQKDRPLCNSCFVEPCNLRGYEADESGIRGAELCAFFDRSFSLPARPRVDRECSTRVYGFLPHHEHFLVQNAENKDPITHRHTATHEV